MKSRTNKPSFTHPRGWFGIVGQVGRSNKQNIPLIPFDHTRRFTFFQGENRLENLRATRINGQ